MGAWGQSYPNFLGFWDFKKNIYNAPYLHDILYVHPAANIAIVFLQFSIFQTKIVLNNGSVQWKGITFDLLDLLACDLNFR